MRKLKQTSMYAKMYLVTPMVYEKLKRCLDKTDMATLDRVNKPYFNNVQTQTFHQQPPPRSFQYGFSPQPPPSQVPPLSTSEKKIDDIIQQEMSIPQSIPQEPEFEEVSNPYMDDSFGFSRGSIQWDRPVTTDVGVQTQQPKSFSTETQTQQPYTTTSEVQTDQPIARRTEFQTYNDPEFFIPTSQPVIEEVEPMELPAIEHEQFPQITFQPTTSETVYGHRKRSNKPKKDHLKKKFSTDLKEYVPPVRSNRLDRIPGPHAQHFGEVLRSQATSNIFRRPAISEVVFTGNELTLPPIQQSRQPLPLTHQQGELPEPRQLEQIQGPPVTLPITFQQGELSGPRNLEPLQGPPQLQQLTYQQGELIGPRNLETLQGPPQLPQLTYQQGELIGPRSLEAIHGPPQLPQLTYQPTQSQAGPSQLIYREKPALLGPRPKLALTQQKKRSLSESSYIPPGKILSLPTEVSSPKLETTKQYLRKSQRLQPTNNEPQDQKIKNFQCDICGILLSTKFSLIRHKERELRRMENLEQQQSQPQQSDFSRWLASKTDVMETEEKDPQPGSKRSATTAKLSNLRRIKRTNTTIEKFPSWFLRPPEKM